MQMQTHMGADDQGLSNALRFLVFTLVASICILHPDLIGQAYAQFTGTEGSSDRDAAVFAEGDAVINTFNKKIINWVRGAGVASLAVCGLLWISTGRANWKWLAGAGGGLFVAGAANAIVKFFMGSSATADSSSTLFQ